MQVADMLAQQGVEFHQASAGRELVLTCPFCQREKLYVNAHTGLWNCQRCGEKGNLWRLAVDVVGLNHFDALRYTSAIQQDAGRTGFQAQRIEEAKTLVRESCLPPGFRKLTDPTVPLEAAYWRYLRGRDVPDATVLAYGMGYVLAPAPCSWRVIVPVRQGGLLMAYAARAIASVAPVKVLYPEGAPMSHLLFNLDRMRPGQEIVITEGVFDALRLPDRSVATFGAHLSATQRGLLRRLTNKVVLCWDGDEVGRTATKQAAAELRSDLFQVRVAELPDGTDPGSLDPVILSSILKHAESFHLFPAGRA